MKKTLIIDLSKYTEDQLVLIAKRTGYHTHVEQAVMDGDGNPLLDENDNQITEQIPNPLSREDHIISKCVDALFKFYGGIIISDYEKQKLQEKNKLELELKSIFLGGLTIE